MKPAFAFTILSLSIGLAACHSSPGKQKTTGQPLEAVKSITPAHARTSETSAAKAPNLAQTAPGAHAVGPNPVAPQAEADTGCVRGQAQPVLAKRYFPNRKFVLQPDGLTAIETTLLASGDQLTIRNWGCEYYLLTFRFETTRFQQDTTNLAYWYGAANELMNEVLPAIKDEPFDLRKGLGVLQRHVARSKSSKSSPLILGEDIDFGGEDIRNFVTLDRAEKMTDRKFAVTITFACGPL